MIHLFSSAKRFGPVEGLIKYELWGVENHRWETAAARAVPFWDYLMGF